MVPLEDEKGIATDAVVPADPVQNRVRRAHQRATSLLSEALAPHSLTPPQWAALAALHHQGPMSQIDLGRSIAMDPATMQGVVVRLIARGLLVRGPDLHDRRRNLVSLSQHGREVVAACAPAVTKADAEFSGRLTPDERDTLVTLLSRLTG